MRAATPTPGLGGSTLTTDEGRAAALMEVQSTTKNSTV